MSFYFSVNKIIDSRGSIVYVKIFEKQFASCHVYDHLRISKVTVNGISMSKIM